MKRKNIIKNQKGFTLVEIIAVLVILGILAAVAAPKFLNLGEEARRKAAVGGIAEAKATLSMGYGKAYLSKGTQPTGAELYTSAGLVSGAQSFGDILLTLGSAGTTISIQATSVKGDTLVTPVNDTWVIPSNT